VAQAAEQEVEAFLAAGGGFRPSSPTYPHPHDKPFDPTKTYKDPNAPPLPVSHDPHGALRASRCSVYGSDPEGGEVRRTRARTRRRTVPRRMDLASAPSS
jgi:hypothetical protein